MTNIFANLIVVGSVTILNGAFTSSTFNTGQLATGQGAAQLQVLAIPTGFPAATLSFNASYPSNAIAPFAPAPYSISDGANTNSCKVSTVGGAQFIGLPPWFFYGIQNIQIITDTAPTGDKIIGLYMQPINQGVPR